MADAIPTPEGKQPPTQSTVVVQQPMSQWSALKQAGWWTNADWTFLVLIAMLWVTFIYWKIFGNPTTEGLIAFLLVNVSVKLVWGIFLIFRCSWFVLRLNADVAVMPEESARIAVAFLQGQQPARKK